MTELEARLRERILVNDATGCWEWQGRLDDGYGHIRYEGRSQPVHRVSYEAFVAPIPDDLCIDHLCRNRACVNPEHLEPVTIKENLRRGVSFSARNSVKTHCIRGHEFTPENTRVYEGKRHCLACRRLWHQADLQARKARRKSRAKR
jgi:hypothetical protein